MSEIFNLSHWALNSREMASLTLLVIFFATALVHGYKSTRDSLLSILKEALVPRLLFLYLSLLLTFFFVVLSANYIGLWELSMIKDSIILVFISLMPLVFGTAFEAESFSEIWLPLRNSVVGGAALTVAYVNLITFSYFTELFIQFFVVVLLLIKAGSLKVDPEKKARLGSGIIRLQSTLGLVLLCAVTCQLFWTPLSDFLIIAKSFFFELYATISFIPVTYAIAMLSGTETLLCRISLQKIEITTRHKIALIVGLRGKLSYSSAFVGGWIYCFPRQEPKNLSRFMAEFRSFVDNQRFFEMRRQEQLKAYAGITGRSSAGLWLDRREFYETKTTLSKLASAQMGQHRNGFHHYREDMQYLLPHDKSALSVEDGFHFMISADKQQWCAWRRSIGGCYLAAGGNEDIDLEWRYAGAEPPSEFPHAGSHQWVAGAGKGSHPEWEFDDAPISLFPKFDMLIAKGFTRSAF